MSYNNKSTLSLEDCPPLTFDHSEQNLNGLLHHLKACKIESTTDVTECVSKASTKHSSCLPHERPTAVLYPRSTEQVSTIAKACHERSIAITTFAGGTSLGGALRSTRGGVCIDFKHMDQLLDVHEDDLDVVVQPNMGWVELNQVLEPRGLFFPPDPAPGAKLGGMVAMSCSGTNAYRYGTMKDWVISLTLVLADGTIIKTRNRPRKSSAGYDLTHLIIGSEGTLALVTEAVLKVTILPKNLHVGMASFPSLQAGVNVAVAVLKSGHLLEAIELADAECVLVIQRSGLAEEAVDAAPTLFLKFAGPQKTVDEQIQIVRSLASHHGAEKVEITSEKSRITSIWGVRKCLAHALVAVKRDPTDLFLHTDAAVPISKMADLVEKSNQLVRGNPKSKAWFCASVGHVGDGNVHTAIVCPAHARHDAEELLAKVHGLALDLDGTITGEHGVGMELRDLLADEVGEEGVNLMRKINLLSIREGS